MVSKETTSSPGQEKCRHYPHLSVAPLALTSETTGVAQDKQWEGDEDQEAEVPGGGWPLPPAGMELQQADGRVQQR